MPMLFILGGFQSVYRLLHRKRHQVYSDMINISYIQNTFLFVNLKFAFAYVFSVPLVKRGPNKKC